MSNEIVTRPDVREVTTEAELILTEARSLKIETNVSYQLAGDELKRIKCAAKKLDEVRKSITQPMDAAKAAVMDLFRGPAQQLTDAETAIKQGMVTYTRVLETRQAEERKAAEAAAAEERERIAAAAAQAAQEGRTDDAEEIAASIATVATAIVPVREAPKVAGFHIRKVWKFRIVNESLIPREYCSPDEKKIRADVNAFKGARLIPGVEIYEDDQSSVRAASF